jgi:acetate kinase
MTTILTLNCGSSSLKFDLRRVDPARPGTGSRIAHGSIDAIGPDAASRFVSVAGVAESQSTARNHPDAFHEAMRLLEPAISGSPIDAVGHRVVHGGLEFRAPALIDERVLRAIESAARLAPLHNGAALAAIAASRAWFGDAVPMVATFDTAFFADLPDVAASYAIPSAVSDALQVRRFGFHGIAHRYMVERYRLLHPDKDAPRVISLQLGAGCSATASIAGRPLDTSMGFTPLEGLIMGTRSGDLDPSLPLYIAEQQGRSLADVAALLNHQSGLLGISGQSADLRVLLAAGAAGDQRADFAVRAFSYRIQKYVGAYLAVLGGADAVIFGGGIGEHSPGIRSRVCEAFAWAGLQLDEGANVIEGDAEHRISTSASTIEAWVIPVDEAAVIAADTAACLQS